MSSPPTLTGDRRATRNSTARQARLLRIQAARNSAAEYRRVTARLRQALDQDGFMLQYHLQTSLDCRAVRGAEAQICLRHKRRGLISPGHFMPVAERSDLGIEIANWALVQACQDIAALNSQVQIAVPVAHRQLLTGDIVKHVIETFSRFNVEANQVEFALTEPMVIDANEDISFVLKALRGLGAGLVLNNFGTNYTSFSLLKRLPLTMLKLDRSMLADLAAFENRAILRASIETAHALGIGVIAEGAETDAQREILGELGCDFVQIHEAVSQLTSAALDAALSRDGP